MKMVIGPQAGYQRRIFSSSSVESAEDMRSEYLKALKDMGVKVEKHHHEVAPSQHELGMYFGTLTDMADNVQLYKYAVQMYQIHLVKLQLLCLNQSKEITVRVCIVTNQYGKEALLYLWGKSMLDYQKQLYIT